MLIDFSAPDSQGKGDEPRNLSRTFLTFRSTFNDTILHRESLITTDAAMQSCLRRDYGQDCSRRVATGHRQLSCLLPIANVVWHAIGVRVRRFPIRIDDSQNPFRPMSRIRCDCPGHFMEGELGLTFSTPLCPLIPQHAEHASLLIPSLSTIPSGLPPGDRADAKAQACQSAGLAMMLFTVPIRIFQLLPAKGNFR